MTRAGSGALVFGMAASLLIGVAMGTTPEGPAKPSGPPTPGGAGGARNRLAGATSPYLLQHAGNPVDWYPWGPEALEAARREDKPIFLSIGYSACHWCHVMAHESFEDPATAEVMNRYFINIKVDREERPDLDDIYMTAVQMLTGSGGWPMSVWLTPDLKPFYGGTYFPNRSLHGRPTFAGVIAALGEAWRQDRASLIAQADKVHEAVAHYMSSRRAASADGPPAGDPLARAVDDMTAHFDFTYGGFGSAPKFPPHRGLALMLARYRKTRDENLLRMATLTFDRMAFGGMYDQVGGGFHRYSTDARWLVPHFEKMLYDNALLADAYIDAWQTTGRDLYRRIVQEIFAWVLREMTDPGGAFYSTLDADSEGEEGRFYVWRPEEVVAVLGPAEGALIAEYYGIAPRGNFENATSIPNVEIPPEAFAQRKGIAAADFARRLDAARGRLLHARAARVRPHLDDKVLTAWNGLMIAALARGARVFDAPHYRDAAARAADFLLGHLRGPDGLMRVSYRDGRVSSEGFLDDQAFFIHGLLALHAATGHERWLKEAIALLKAADGAFLDRADGTYFFTQPGRTDVIVRAKNPTDGAIPSGNSVMAQSLLELARATGEPAWRARAGEVLAAFRASMDAMPAAFHNMIAAMDAHLSGAPAARAPRAVVEVSAAPAAEESPAGGKARVDVRVDVQEGWHINSAAPGLPYLIPTAVTLSPGAGLTLEDAVYPEGRMRTFGFAGNPISVYQGSQVIRLTLAVDLSATPGPVRTRGWLTFQACDEISCLPPEQKGFDIELRVAARMPGS